MNSGLAVSDVFLLRSIAKVGTIKIIGTAQVTGTRGHAFTSKVIAYRYAFDPRVQRVTLDLGYKRLLGHSPLRYGSRPDVGVLFKNKRFKVFEVGSKTDNLFILRSRNQKWINKISQQNFGRVHVYEFARYLNYYWPK